MKKTKILWVLVLVTILLGLSYQVYAKYVIKREISVGYTTSDYYFEPQININVTKTLPVTVDVTVKNHNGTDYTDEDLNYALRVSDGYTLTVVDGVNQRKLTGGQKSEETFKVTINKTGDQKNENIQIYFDVTTPYTTTVSTKIAYQDVYDYDYTGNYEEFIALATGTYKIECWGAQGGSYGSSGGNGAYTTGEIELEENQKLYVFVGQVGDEYETVKFNGGGKSGRKYNARSGGGASDVRLYVTEDGAWNAFDSLKSRIMISAGGGGSEYYHEVGSNGGAGGALVGINGGYYTRITPAAYTVAQGGTQLNGGAGFVGLDTLYHDGSFGTGGDSPGHGGGGGGGYFGGGAGGYVDGLVGSGAGGSSFISGHSGCDAIAENSTEANIIHTGQANHYSDYVFTSTKIVAGNASMPTHDGTSTMVGNAGDGHVKITFIQATVDSTQVAITTTKNDGNTATINATATDNGAGVKQYDFYINNELKHTATTSDLTASYSFDYASTFGTTYDTYVVVTDNNNATSKSNTSTIVDYTVSTRQDLEAFRDSVNNGNKYTGETITQTANIDLQGSESNQWTPIGNYGENSNLYFAGTYEGNNYTISNIYINQSTKDYQGLFGYANSANINNLEIENVNITGQNYVGNIVGLVSQSTLHNIHITSGVLNGKHLTGGIIGHGQDTQITQCSNKSNINTTQDSNPEKNLGAYGGIAGRIASGKVEGCVNYGNITGDAYVGGITGINWTETLNCYNTGTIKGVLNDTNIGGISGVQNGANNVGQKIVNCYNIGTVISEDTYKGGIVGFNDCVVTNCYYLEGTANGGITGANVTGQAEVRTSETMKTTDFVDLLGNSKWKLAVGANNGYPILWWQIEENGLVSITTTKNDEKTATINATAEDNGAGVKKYDFYINDELKHTVTTSDLTASYSFDYASTFGTTYDTYVVVTDNNNAASKSNTSTIVDYTISDKQDMELFRDSVNNGNAYENETIIQTASIDLEGSETNQWNPIGTVDTPFNGNFEGNGNNISGLYINQEKGFLGLFGIMKAGSIKSLTVEGTITVTGGEADTVIGGIISRNLGANIDSCTNKVNIIGVARIGGIVGKNEAGSITNCTNYGKIEVNDMANSKWIGGIAGVGYGQIDSCVNEGNIVGNLAGGIVGISNNGATTVSNCINNAEIKGNTIGGIQYYSDSTINNCINNGSVVVYGVTSNTSVRAAGIASILEGNIEQCVNKGEIKADWNETNVGHIYVGGIVAEQRDGTRIAECYNEGNVIGNTKNSDSEVVSATYPGGIVSFSNGGTIINCYNKGSVSAYKLSGTNTNNAGGIICLTNSESTNVESCYNIGTVTATRGDGAISYTGGVVGRIQVEGTISNCYYLEGTATGGINGADVTGQAEVRTSAIMKTTEFKDLLGDEKWKIVQGVNYGYPILWWQQDKPKVSTLADVVSVGDYVNYDANSNGTYTFTSNDCLTGTSISATISSADKFNNSAPSQWRVLSVDKEAGTVELMSTDPTAQSLTLEGSINGFINSETVLNNIGAIYGHGKGATGGRSITIEDIEQYSNYDRTKFGYGNYIYGDTRPYTSGIFVEEIKDSAGNITDYGTTITSSATLTLTYYGYEAKNYFTDTNKYNMIFKNSTNINNNKSHYWMASRCSGLYDNYGTFMVRVIYDGSIYGHQIYDSSNQGYTRTEYVSIVVPLETNIQTTGQDTNGVWQLSVE